MDIEYFEFLKMFPDIIDTDNLGVDPIYYINYVKKMHDSGDTKLIKLNMRKFSDLVLKSIETKTEKCDIIRNDLAIRIHDDILISLKINDSSITIRNNLNELKGNFNISVMDGNYFYLKTVELKNLKRNILIEEYLNEKDC